MQSYFSKLLLFAFLLLLSILQMAPGEAGCMVCGQVIELGYEQSYLHSVKVQAGTSYRLKLAIDKGELLFHESKLRKQGTLLCGNTADTISCVFTPYKSGKSKIYVTSESKKSWHTLWFEKK